MVSLIGALINRSAIMALLELAIKTVYKFSQIQRIRIVIPPATLVCDKT